MIEVIFYVLAVGVPLVFMGVWFIPSLLEEEDFVIPSIAMIIWIALVFFLVFYVDIASRNQAYEEGVLCSGKVEYEENPYRQDSREWVQWRKGYLKGKQNAK